MNSTEIFLLGYRMSSAQALLEAMGAVQFLSKAFREEGLTNKDLQKIAEFGNSSTEGENLGQKTVDKAVESYMEDLRRLRFLMEMADGYQEMGDLNLELANDPPTLEEEGEEPNEVGTEETEAKAE